MSKILVIDDEQGIREVLTGILDDEGYTVFTAEDGIDGLTLLKSEPIDLVLLDVWLPNMGGIDVLKQIKETYPEIEVIIISGHGNIDLAVKAVKLGAFDFMEKPLSLERVVTVVRNAIQMENLRRENRLLRNSILQNDEILGETDAIRRIREIIAQSAATDSRILITGENGTGKELVAREIHRRSRRARSPFIEVNCAAIPDNLIESELFGHEKGSFTGAVARRRGKFELADRGTLFLDEVADMSLSAQAKVLRAIQEMKFERVGGEESISVDVRLIAATNKNIQQQIADGAFREDLFFRLNVIPIHVPPLRERSEDLPLLIEHFLSVFRNPPDGPAKRVDSRGMAALQDHDWPGNIRELKNFVERVTIMTDEEVITADLIRHFLGEAMPRRRASDFDEYQEMGLNEAKDSFEKRYIMQKLEENGNNISRTAEAMGIYPSNLHGKIRKFGIKIEK
ncbi:MAG: sigma-54-dependent Fis family transcriptional regulator [Spirochaetaceae bacterium]|nr:MAG: sigma-54-dependent Fis family transcriptional regulator [Spirochaetaceae bacterium]